MSRSPATGLAEAHVVVASHRRPYRQAGVHMSTRRLTVRASIRAVPRSVVGKAVSVDPTFGSREHQLEAAGSTARQAGSSPPAPPVRPRRPNSAITASVSALTD